MEKCIDFGVPLNMFRFNYAASIGAAVSVLADNWRLLLNVSYSLILLFAQSAVHHLTRDFNGKLLSIRIVMFLAVDLVVSRLIELFNWWWRIMISCGSESL